MSSLLERLQNALGDRYRFERELGAGGMAIVFLATDLRHQRRVAVKVMRQELASAIGTERFLREIKLAARLQHPHILQLFDSGQTDGLLYYVMPYIAGETLRHRLMSGALSVSEATRILRDVADALAYAHSEGLVHRDIKPDNVMLSGRHALVADFGVAKALGASAVKRSRELERQSALQPTWRPSRSVRQEASITVPTCMPSVSWPTKCYPGPRRFGPTTWVPCWLNIWPLNHG